MISGKIQYAVIEGNYIVKFLGDVRLTLCSTLDNFADKMFACEDFKQVVIDLSETENIDSTSLGLIARISIQCTRHAKNLPTIVSPKGDITRLLLSMGFDQVFSIVEQPEKFTIELKELPCQPCSEKETKDKVITAHRTLMMLSEKNKTLFHDLVSSLETENLTHNSNPHH